MPDTEKAEDAPETTEEEHPLVALRREGLRLNPQWQTEHLDTSGDVATDIHRISSVFAEAHDHAVRAAAAAADADYAPDTVVFPDDKADADAAREHVRKVAAELPEEPEKPPVGGADGMGGPYGQGIVPAPDEASGEEKSETPAKAKPTRASTAKTTSK